jgi:hypothetical protein
MPVAHGWAAQVVSLATQVACTLSLVGVLLLRSESVVWAKVGEDVVMLELESSSYFTVRGSGTVIIERLADGATEESLVESVTRSYNRMLWILDLVKAATYPPS